MEARSQLRHRPTIGNAFVNQNARNSTIIFAHAPGIVNVRSLGVVAQFEFPMASPLRRCVPREIPRPAGKNAGASG